MALEEITDDKLQDLILQPKQVTNPKARRSTKEKYERIDYNVIAQKGESKFQIYVRQNVTDREDFSCGIRWLMPSGDTLTLARYNGSNHIHHDTECRIEYRCHIHRASEKALREGRKPEHYAKPTDRFFTLAGALHCLLFDLKVSGLESHSDQWRLFK